MEQLMKLKVNKNGHSVENSTDIGRAVQEFCRRDAVLSKLYESGLECDFQDGGCKILAKALCLWIERNSPELNPAMVAICTEHYPLDSEDVFVKPQHFLCKITLPSSGQEIWLDSDGAGSQAEQMLKLDMFHSGQFQSDVFYTEDFDPQHDEIPLDNETSVYLSGMLEAALPSPAELLGIEDQSSLAPKG